MYHYLGPVSSSHSELDFDGKIQVVMKKVFGDGLQEATEKKEVMEMD